MDNFFQFYRTKEGRKIIIFHLKWSSLDGPFESMTNCLVLELCPVFRLWFKLKWTIQKSDLSSTVNVQYPDEFGYQIGNLACNRTLITGRPFDNRTLII
jgi:hypothetical protein